MRKTFGFVATLLCLGLAVGCSSNDDSGNDAGAAGSAAGTGASGSGASGSGASGTGAAGTTAGDGGLQVTCEPGETPPTSCGGTTCPEVPAQLADFCQVVCCTEEDTCGTRNASTEAAGTDIANCRESAVLDPNCPSQEIMFMGSMQTLPGCRLNTGGCGVSVLGTICFDPCDAPNANCDEDGGV